MTPIEITVLVVGALLGTGGLATLLKFRGEHQKLKSEGEALAVTAQGTIIANLQSENTRLSNEIQVLRVEIAEVRGHLAAMERLKVDQIAEAVAARVISKLVGDNPAELID